MIIKCTDGEKEKILSDNCISDFIDSPKYTAECASYSKCEKCYERHGIKFEIVEDSSNE